MQGNLLLVNKTRASVRASSFQKIKDEVLGAKYELSVALIGPKEMREVTLRSKKKDKVSNVLSFPLTKTSGEILLCPAAAKPYSLIYLFIHGCLHLKGMRHGGTMEATEQRLLGEVSSFTHAKNSHRNRRRLVPRKSGNRR